MLEPHASRSKLNVINQIPADFSFKHHVSYYGLRFSSIVVCSNLYKHKQCIQHITKHLAKCRSKKRYMTKNHIIMSVYSTFFINLAIIIDRYDLNMCCPCMLHSILCDLTDSMQMAFGHMGANERKLAHTLYTCLLSMVVLRLMIVYAIIFILSACAFS